MAYRASSPAEGLPFPRRHLAALTTLVVLASVLAFFLPIPLFAGRHWREGGWGMYVLALLGLVVSVGVGWVGAFAVRGKRTASIILSVLPAASPIAGAVLVFLAFEKTLAAVASASVEAALELRIALERASEANALFRYGTLGGASFVAASAALLTIAGSIDRRRANVPGSKWWMVALVLGIASINLVVFQRVVDEAPLASTIVVVPSLALVTILSVMAARNGSLLRGWHDPHEARVAASSMLAAALLAAAGVVLIDLALRFSAESAALGAMAGDRATKARLIAESVMELRKLSKLPWFDGVAAFAIVMPALFATFGRGPDGRPRRPLVLAASSVAAFGAVVAVALAVGGVQAWKFRSLERLAHQAALPAQLELPTIELGDSVVDEHHVAIVVRADGSFTENRGGYTGTFGVAADRRAKWRDVRAAVVGASKIRPTFDALTFGIAPKTYRATPRLDGYEEILGPDETVVRVKLAPFAAGTVSFDDADDMQTVAATLAKAGPRATIHLDL